MKAPDKKLQNEKTTTANVIAAVSSSLPTNKITMQEHTPYLWRLLNRDTKTNKITMQEHTLLVLGRLVKNAKRQLTSAIAEENYSTAATLQSYLDGLEMAIEVVKLAEN